MKAYAVTDSMGFPTLNGIALHELVRERPLRASEDPQDITQELHPGALGDLLAPRLRGFNGLANYVLRVESCLANKGVMYGHLYGLYVIRCNGKDYVQSKGRIFVKRLGVGGRTL